MSIHLNHNIPKVVHKPWGEERWHVLSKDFCVKTIKLLKGTRTSFQYHVKKEEINFIREGTAEVWLQNEEGILNKHIMATGDSFFVPALRRHRVVALSDVEMFEVSNEFVDDVVRINDEFGRGDGRIDAEHQTPAVLILAAGLGSRLKHLTETKNKALIPIGNKAVISYVIERFPKEYDIVMAVGYKADSLIEYCQLAHPNRNFQFVHVQDWDNPKTDPGHSAFQCRQYLQRPFYLATVDCLIEQDTIPHIDGNWIGVYPTDYPEKYATIESTEDGRVASVAQKAARGYRDAFIGVAAILDYNVFWNQLENSPIHELVSAWGEVGQYPTLRSRTLRWFDTGNLDDLNTARAHFGVPDLASHKATEEIVYSINGRLIKYSPDPIISANRLARGKGLWPLVPPNLTGTSHFIAYDWQDGKNLYQHDSLALYNQFLESLGSTIDLSSKWVNPELIYSFYDKKTQQRLSLFESSYGVRYFSEHYTINGIRHKNLLSILARLDYRILGDNPLYDRFHGDLHFDNLIYDEVKNKFVYIDWRESFAGKIDGGDLYYDLGKLYAGCMVPFELLKNDSNVNLAEGSSSIIYSYEITPNLLRFTRDYEQWILHRGYDLRIVRIVAGLAFLNIAPLHTPLWNKVLFFNAIQLLDASV